MKSTTPNPQTVKPINRHTTKPLLLTALLLLTLTSLFPRMYHIKQDGTGHFTTITAGINAAVNGDTLLVYPGRYVENINYSGRNITITSLYGVEGNNRRFIRETVIDGNQSGAVVTFRNNESRNAVLNGFTITNGSGYYIPSGTSRGGGIYIIRSSPIISNCIIEYNNAQNCGGILVSDGNPFLAGNIVRYNRAVRNVGGVMGDNVQFCSDNLNSIYFNNAGFAANDLAIRVNTQHHVIIDTFTVMNADPEEMFILSINRNNVPENFIFTVLNAKIEPIASDLYVSTAGCNTNDGLTPDTPLQTIAFAMTKIDPSGTGRRNIFVADGLYSASQNNQMFPVQVRSNVNVIGESKENTILDMEYRGWAFSAYITPFYNTYRSDFSIRNFSIKNGGDDQFRYLSIYSGMRLYYAKDFEIENIIIKDGITEMNGPILSYYIANFEMRNIEILNCIGSRGMWLGIGGGGTSEKLSFNIENLRINSFSYPTPTPRDQYGISLQLMIASNVEIPVEGTITNLEITDGVIDRIDHFWGQYPYSHFMYLNEAVESPPRKLKIVNATIGNNSAPGRTFGGGMFFEGGVDAEIINSIIYRNTPGNITLHNPRNHQMDINISHSILGGGTGGILRYGASNANIHWGEGSLTDDPQWSGGYRLSEDSPAIGAGTLVIPDFTFPEFDLAGNPRIVDGRIDMGAYQWHPVQTSVEERDEVTKGLREGEFNLRNFPNPAVTLVNHSTVGVEGHRSSTTGTNIAFELPEAGNVMIEIYNLKGQLVKRIFDAYIPQGEYNVFWDGRDERERYVATGFYMYNLHFNEQLVATGRCTFIK